MGRYNLRDTHSGDPKTIYVGKHSYGYGGIKLYNSQEKSTLHIGKFCSFAWGVGVFLGGIHNTKYNTTFPFGRTLQNEFPNFPKEFIEWGKEWGSTNGDVIVGNDVWVGANVTILSGVTIGDGAVISTNSTVYRNVKPYSIVGGNPAEFWAFRFDQDRIKKLRRMEWWNWEDSQINEALPFICSKEIDKLYEYYENNIIKNF